MLSELKAFKTNNEKHELQKQVTLLILGCLFIPFSHAADFTPAKPMPSVPLADGHLVTRIAFGSCGIPTNDDSIYDEIRKTNADVFLFIGDNVYSADESDDPELKSLKVAYGKFAESNAFASLRATIPTLVTWDDHDYGLNDAGGDWPHKALSQSLFNFVWAVDDDDPRAARDGVYFSRIVGPENRRVQFILLDTRYFRTPLKKAVKALSGGGSYMPTRSKSQNMLGEAQWQWLEQQLRQPADLRIIATSIQMIADGHNWEAWRLMPRERLRFYKLLGETGAKGVVLISGDRHSAAIYRQTNDVAYPLWEVTSSSLNLPLSSFLSNIKTEPGPYRIGQPYYDANFGVIDIDWASRRLILQIRDESGRTVLAANVSLESLGVEN